MNKLKNKKYTNNNIKKPYLIFSTSSNSSTLVSRTSSINNNQFEYLTSLFLNFDRSCLILNDDNDNEKNNNFLNDFNFSSFSSKSKPLSNYQFNSSNNTIFTKLARAKLSDAYKKDIFVSNSSNFSTNQILNKPDKLKKLFRINSTSKRQQLRTNSKKATIKTSTSNSIHDYDIKNNQNLLSLRKNTSIRNSLHFMIKKKSAFSSKISSL